MIYCICKTLKIPRVTSQGVLGDGAPGVPGGHAKYLVRVPDTYVSAEPLLFNWRSGYGPYGLDEESNICPSAIKPFEKLEIVRDTS